MGSVGAANAAAIGEWLRSDAAPKYLLVSCRSGEFYGQINIPNLTEIELLPLAPEQIVDFATRYLGDRAPRFLDAITADGPPSATATGVVGRQGIKSLAANPYLLSALITFQTSSNDSIPHNLGALFSRLSKAIFERERIRGALNTGKVADIEKRLGRLAYSMIDEGAGTSVAIEQAMQYLGSDTAIGVAVNAGFLTPNDADNTVRFAHQLFQEYFSARKIRARRMEFGGRRPQMG
jgi:predicted NACHT family NTPase